MRRCAASTKASRRSAWAAGFTVLAIANNQPTVGLFYQASLSHATSREYPAEPGEGVIRNDLGAGRVGRSRGESPLWLFGQADTAAASSRAPSTYVTVLVPSAGARGPGSTMPTRFSGSAAEMTTVSPARC